LRWDASLTPERFLFASAAGARLGVSGFFAPVSGFFTGFFNLLPGRNGLLPGRNGLFTGAGGLPTGGSTGLWVGFATGAGLAD
jgi:hypothetical protein